MILFLLIFILNIFTSPVFAGSDVSITCTADDNCTKNTDLPIFNETNIFPGFLTSQKLYIDNNRNDYCNLVFNASSPNTPTSILSNKIMISVTGNTQVLHSSSLSALLDGQNHTLGRIAPGSQALYLWTASFSQSAGNQYQNLSTTFDLDFNFSCDTTFAPTSTTLPTPSQPLLTIDDIPLHSYLGQTFPVYFSLRNFLPDQTYYYKFYGGQSSNNYNIKTIFGSQEFDVNDKWYLFPTITTDSSGNALNQMSYAKIKNNGTLGIYNFRMSVMSAPQEGNPVTADPKTISILSPQSPTPTASQTISTDDPQPQVLGASTVCSDTPPTSAPDNIVAIPGVNTVTLSWSEPIAPFTYYLIAYGTSPGVYQYGNPNIGTPGTTSYTVTNLSSDTTYYFAIRVGNGCAPGPFSSEVSATPLGIVIPQQESAPGFQPDVLGASDDIQQTVHSSTSLSGQQVLGDADTCLYWYPLFSFFALIFNLVLVRRRPKNFSILLPILAISLIGYFSDRLLLKNNCCVAILCRYFWLISLTSFFLPLNLSKNPVKL